MAALERDGYLDPAPHECRPDPDRQGLPLLRRPPRAARVPRPGGRQQVRRFFDHAHGEIEQMLERTSGLLADLTDCTAMVVGPSHESAAIRSVQLVGLGPRLALLVVVLADGAVQKQTIELPEETDDALLAAAAAPAGRPRPRRIAGPGGRSAAPSREPADRRRRHRRIAGAARAWRRRRSRAALRRGLVADGRGLRRRRHGAVGARPSSSSSSWW